MPSFEKKCLQPKGLEEPKKTLKNSMILLKALAILLLIYILLCLALVGCQRQVVYYPSKATEEQLDNEARKKGMVRWRGEDGTSVGWKMAAAGDGSRAVVVFHGNAGYALHRTYIADGFEALEEEHAWSVYLFEYPGYGARPGQPSQSTFQTTAAAAISSLFDDYEKLFVVGESIGTGVATHLAERFSERIDGLLLITPFTSLVDVGKKHYPIFPIDLLLRERYDNRSALRHYQGPVAFLIAGNDEIIPNSLSYKLYEGYDGFKRMWIQEGQGHNTLNFAPSAPWWQEMAGFLLHPRSASGRD